MKVVCKHYTEYDYEALNRARPLGAKKAYVLSDMPFYEKLGFRKDKHFTFFWKRGE